MVATYEVLDTTGYTWYSSGLGNPSTELTSWIDVRFKAWLGEICNPVLDSGSIVGGSGYTDGTYNNVDLVRTNNLVNGRDLQADVTISGGAVTTVTVTQKGNGYKTGDVLTFPDLSQVGGTGAGFTINVLSADASICINRDPDEYTSSIRGWLVGFERGPTNATFGRRYLSKASSTSTTTYNAQVYGWTDTTANSGEGTYLTNSVSETFWRNSDAGTLVHLFYCSEADNQFFMIYDDINQHGHGLCRAVRDPSGTYVSESMTSTWVGLITDTSSFRYDVTTNATWNSPYQGSRGFVSFEYPYDTFCLFRGNPIWGRGAIIGQLPSYIGVHYPYDIADTGGSTISDGSEVWTSAGQASFYRTT